MLSTLLSTKSALVLRVTPLLIILLSPHLQCAPAQPPPAPLCAPCIRADMDFLASDELHGRGSATRDEHLAALYAASVFEQLGLEPGGDNGSFLQRAPLPNPLPQQTVNRLKNYETIPRTETWNAVAILRGADAASHQTPGDAILLTAHLDHLGIGPPVNGDAIYNGADDDASGTAAVLALARALSREAAAGKSLRRTVIFALFGSEELGGFGNRYFLEHPPVSLDHVIANLEFEMIGRADPAVPPGKFWLTGYERSNLGAELVRHGARLAADPHPSEKFFERSDNYALAKRGVVAQTVSSFNLHKDYHQPSDELGRINFAYMTEVINSMVAPIEWLADSGFRPAWAPGGRP